ncbi:MAG: transporter substrate-binding domain-containing protein [Clostridiales bacterium]|jgi:polar amino acid transport system substrate-binding protein|nr:transporter substrate-binding domain-containing protein [Clostridiales bacterium]
MNKLVFYKKNKNLMTEVGKKIFFFITVIMFCSFLGCTKNKSYIVAFDPGFPPFGYGSSNDKYIGIDIDLMMAIAENQSFNYEIKPLGFASSVAALESNQVDIVIAGMSVTEERKIKYDFSDPYYESCVVMAIKNNNQKIKCYEDLNENKVAVKTGTQGSKFAEIMQEKYHFKIGYFDDSPSMYDEVKTGHSIACFEDLPVMEFGISRGNDLKILLKDETKTFYSAAVIKGKNIELLRQFNQGLKNIKENGKYKEIIDKYAN